MSIWNDIRKKSLGRKSRKEELAMIYPEDNKTTILEKEEFAGNEYVIKTTGDYPFLQMQTNNRMNPISIFSGHDTFKVDIDGKKYVIRIHRYSYVGAIEEEGFTYSYSFNKEDDYVAGKHPGKEWTMDEMRNLAKKMIAAIQEEEKRLFTDVWK